MSVVDAFQDIDNYLLANNLSDCGCRLSGPSGHINAAGPIKELLPSCPPGGLTIIINRAYYFPANGTFPLLADCEPRPLPGRQLPWSPLVSAFSMRILGSSDELPAL